jgi:hypothetical protein
MIKRLAAPAACLCLLSVLMISLPVDAVTVRLPREENALFGAIRVEVGGEIQLNYRHSVEKTMVEGVFAVGPGPVLQAKETRMASVGTGLPNTYSGRTRVEGQWIIVDEGLATIPGFDFFISTVNATRLSVNGTAIPVGMLASGSVIRLDVERLRLVEWLRWRYLKKDWRKDQQ